MNRQLISIGVTVLLLSGATVAAQPVTSVSAFDPLVERLREAVSTSDIDGYLELLAADAVREDAELFAEEVFTSGLNNVVMQARFAVPLRLWGQQGGSHRSDEVGCGRLRRGGHKMQLYLPRHRGEPVLRSPHRSVRRPGIGPEELYRAATNGTARYGRRNRSHGALSGE